MNQKPEIGNPIRTKAILERYGLRAKKSLGQNFLTDTNVLNNIVSAAEITKADNVIEIGPGIGALTEKLAQAAGEVVALEIDEDLLDVLYEVLFDYDNVKVINKDVLKTDVKTLINEEFSDPSRPIKVVANLPYYITTPILMQLLSVDVKWASIVVMMQKEVAQRLAAEPGTKAYGTLSLAIQYKMDVRLAFEVPRTVFVPAPNVDSAIVELTPRHEALAVLPDDEKGLFRLIKGCFSHRRKTLANNLQGVVGKGADKKAQTQTILTELSIAPSVRPERLSLDQFILLANRLRDAELI
ncbi:16S ribosomal RNA methyltransferase KsgA Dim1 family protein [Paucilactobacillus vaccinostercus DSM 20634]|jgi:16S rRNA (adenine1518-N6/adenine1519-N6)-dimethyltransferase|uniref:Ribosomal RNA small subunit methyltransferase A n=1 Tax=Paucilactobacillus vaccinostercus DSM 20634 TaxID=1423813 RepID=A0A0R2AIU6_9LACO|nr:16S rRNA (adenine(1518)-N(6)/adenine(1519)-N(6))-dimethyltransferase RsmA [Paucilactobacillus vaccinostercus]KRM62796.1 16S ribosomal RNA methyltransferase KsgA Dim1 family protein [Paucilactobacillus vaccinostercus DSM 20634]